jgi:hypothetical protein
VFLFLDACELRLTWIRGVYLAPLGFYFIFFYILAKNLVMAHIVTQMGFEVARYWKYKIKDTNIKMKDLAASYEVS